jgi:PAT family acetyl-CoA transporter-like MFS transporter 1
MELRSRKIEPNSNLDGHMEQPEDDEDPLLEDNQDDDADVQFKSNKGRFGGDGKNIAVLLFLYVLQGIPLGLAAAVPLILTNRHVSYRQQAEFSFAYWPFSVKLLWAPIVDSLFIRRFGRRKTWLVPVQYCIGITMLLLAQNVDYYLDSSPPDVFSLTCMFFFLNFLAATQVQDFCHSSLESFLKHIFHPGYCS